MNRAEALTLRPHNERVTSRLRAATPIRLFLLFVQSHHRANGGDLCHTAIKR